MVYGYEKDEDGNYIGRSEFDSPEVDPEVLIRRTEDLKIGEFYNVQVDSAEEFDLYAHLV